MDIHKLYMFRCLELARLGAGFVAPNPMVGAVLVHNERIIGEGYHMKYGEPHAEVNCINSVAEEDKVFISQSVIYVSLEPCAHFGKTPPCSNLIIAHKIKKVVVGCRDPFDAVNGKGIEQLRAAGIEVIEGVLEKECKGINERFFHFHLQKRPFIVLKWAQSNNGMIAGEGKLPIKISNDFTNRLVHKWRGEEAGIMVGTGTAMADNPKLDTRLGAGPNPVRLVIDRDLKLPAELNLFDKSQKTIVFNYHKNSEEENLVFVKVEAEREMLTQILDACYRLNIQSILVEGGTILLQSFLDMNLWDQLRVIENRMLVIKNGIHSPSIKSGILYNRQQILTDTISYYTNSN